jgi:hypothetical protein
VVPENRNKIKKTSAGKIAVKAGTTHAPYFSALSFDKSLRVTS